MKPMKPYSRIVKDNPDFFLNQKNELWAYSNHFK